MSSDLPILGALGQPYPEELVEGAAVLLGVAREAVHGADEQDLVPAPLRGLSRIALAAAPVLRSDHYLAALLDVAAQFIHVAIVLDAQLYRQSLGLLDLDKLVLP